MNPPGQRHLVAVEGSTAGSQTPPWQRHLVAVESSMASSQPLPDLRIEQNGNLQVFLSGIGDTFVTLKANAKKIVTLKCIWHHIYTKLLL